MPVGDAEIGRFHRVTAAIGAEQRESWACCARAIELVGVQSGGAVGIEEEGLGWRRIPPHEQSLSPKRPAGMLVINQSIDHAIGWVARVTPASRLAVAGVWVVLELLQGVRLAV